MSNYSPSPAELQVFTVSDGVVHKSGSDLTDTPARTQACYTVTTSRWNWMWFSLCAHCLTARSRCEKLCDCLPSPFFSHRTTAPCATHKNNNVSNKVHRWKIAGPQWENTYNTRINSANDVEWPALPVINSSRAINQLGTVAMDVSLPLFCWELIKMRPSDALPYSADKISLFPQPLPPRDCSCSARPVGVAAPLHLAQLAPSLAPDRLGP